MSSQWCHLNMMSSQHSPSSVTWLPVYSSPWLFWFAFDKMTHCSLVKLTIIASSYASWVNEKSTIDACSILDWLSLLDCCSSRRLLMCRLSYVYEVSPPDEMMTCFWVDVYQCRSLSACLYRALSCFAECVLWTLSPRAARLTKWVDAYHVGLLSACLNRTFPWIELFPWSQCCVISSLISSSRFHFGSLIDREIGGLPQWRNFCQYTTRYSFNVKKERLSSFHWMCSSMIMSVSSLSSVRSSS